MLIDLSASHHDQDHDHDHDHDHPYLTYTIPRRIPRSRLRPLPCHHPSARACIPSSNISMSPYCKEKVNYHGCHPPTCDSTCIQCNPSLHRPAFCRPVHIFFVHCMHPRRHPT
ncbi:hypothetical protein DM02DRAFT_316786 [Periconia macrospinosa]|uniref:Uncharacterized protein n=1 Tax=Periconia macrospinosa TaxID=97972 RepID=A0A2V1DVF1_9PLEO|nr:hypothetical protein DM02DRAFT_316786 [Periconia macrospinosa]